MATAISILFGAGLILIWSSFWEPVSRTRGASRLQYLVRDRLSQAGMHNVSLWVIAAACIAIGFVSWLVILSTTTSIAIASVAGALLSVSPIWYISHRARKQRVELSVLWPEAIDDLISGIRAGMTLPEALGSLGERGPEPLQEYFAGFAADYRATGRFNQSLDALKETIADPDADRIIESLRITREVGGTDLTSLLTTLGNFLRKDLRTRAELKARQSWTTAGARIATAAPWIVLALLSTRSETAQAFDSRLGIIILTIGAGVSAVAYSLMLRLGRLPEQERVLR